MKNKTISLKLTDELYRKLKRLESTTGLSQAEIIRFLIFKADGNLEIKKTELEKVRKEVSRIAVNINQIAKHLNTYKENADTREHLRAINEINKLLQFINDILR